MTTCLFCGEEEVVDLQEVWGHEFMLEACCEGQHDWLARNLADDPEWAARWLEVRGAWPLRRMAITDDGYGQMLLDYGIALRRISREAAMAFVRQHHSHNGPLRIDRFRVAAWNGPTLVGVVVVGNPTTPSLMNRGWVEVRRLCTARTIPAELRYRAASALYDWAASEAERRGWRRIITYTLKSESGMTLRYTKPKWRRVGKASREGASWARRGANRVEGPTEEKVLWERVLSPRQPRMIQATFAFPRQARRAA